MARYFFITSDLWVNQADDSDGEPIHNKRRTVDNVFDTYEDAENTAKTIRISRYFSDPDYDPADND